MALPTIIWTFVLSHILPFTHQCLPLLMHFPFQLPSPNPIRVQPIVKWQFLNTTNATESPSEVIYPFCEFPCLVQYNLHVEFTNLYLSGWCVYFITLNCKIFIVCFRIYIKSGAKHVVIASYIYIFFSKWIELNWDTVAVCLRRGIEGRTWTV